jgi:hypothetical protein
LTLHLYGAAMIDLDDEELLSDKEMYGSHKESI